MWTALAAKNASGVQSALKQGANPNSRDEDGVTPLLDAVGLGSEPIVAILLSAKANPNSRDKDGFSALMAAAGTDKVSITRRLLAQREIAALGAHPLVPDAKRRHPNLFSLFVSESTSFHPAFAVEKYPNQGEL